MNMAHNWLEPSAFSSAQPPAAIASYYCDRPSCHAVAAPLPQATARNRVQTTRQVPGWRDERQPLSFPGLLPDASRPLLMGLLLARSGSAL
jgi:hypothetical protein